MYQSLFQDLHDQPARGFVRSAVCLPAAAWKGLCDLEHVFLLFIHVDSPVIILSPVLHLSPALHALTQCRFDFPQHWTSVMADLTAAAAWQGPQHIARNGRALGALKHLTAGLRSKRIVVEASQEATSPGVCSMLLLVQHVYHGLSALRAKTACWAC